MGKSKPEHFGKKGKFSKKKIFWSVIGFLFIVFAVFCFWYYLHILDGLPPLEELENPKPKLASNVLSANGELIGQYYIENRIEANIDSIPQSVIDALIATEDREFYSHWGVNLQRFLQAMIKNIFLGKREGASTITQQMAKNLFELKSAGESTFDTITRKLREWLTAIQIEKTYTKSEILEMYFNISYFGHGAYGIETAAQLYFSKRVKELTLEEAAVLIALLKSWVVYDPIKRYNNSLSRRNLVLRNLLTTGFLNEEEYDSLSASPIEIVEEKVTKGFRSTVAPHFVEYVRKEMEKLADNYGYNLYEDGLTIYTSLDTTMQGIANRVTVKHLDYFQELFDQKWSWSGERELLGTILHEEIRKTEQYRNAETEEEKKIIYDRLKSNIAFVDSVQREKLKIEMGFVCLDAKTGEIKAMVGGRDQKFRYGLNHVTQIRRQPGSSFKPVIYTVAIDNGLYPAFPLLNQRFDYFEWSPENFDLSTGGFLTLRDGLRSSVNLITARLIVEGHVQLYQVGRYAEKMGIKSKLDLVPSISLGTAAVTPLEITSLYATIANRGIYNEPIAIKKIEDKDGILLAQFSSSTSEALHEETAYIITDMLQTVMNEGTGSAVRSMYQFMRPAGGKTGTTQEYADTWFVGFTPQLAAGVWVGFDDHRIKFTGTYGQGSKAALPIWAMFMKGIYDSLDLPIEDFELPTSGNVVSVTFCEESIYQYGDPRLYSDDCSGKVTDIVKMTDTPTLMFNSDRDTSIKIFNRFLYFDSLSHEAIEITDESEE